MAPAAVASGRGRGLVADLRALLRPAPWRGEMALRLAVICTLVTLVTEYYGTLDPALTAYVVFFMNHPERTTSVIFSIVFVVIITVVITLVFGLAILVLDAPAWRVAAMMVLSFVFLFLGSASKLRPVAPILALIVAYALDLLGNIPLGELATRGLLYAWLFVGIPAGVTLVVNLIAGPAPRRMVETALAHRLRLAAAMLGDPTPATRAALAREEEDGVAEQLKRLRLAHIEQAFVPKDAAAMTAAVHSTATLLSIVGAASDEPELPADWRALPAATLDEMARAFDRGGYPVRIDGIGSPEGVVPGSTTAMLADEFDRVLAAYAQPAPAPATPAPAKKGGFFLPDAFTNPEHVQYALKTTGAAMFCYLLYVLLDWPGIHTCLITCYIVSLGTVGETVEKLSLRILGCLVGAAVGLAAIVWVMPGLETIWGLLGVVFIGALAAGWVAAGSPRIAYAGFQIAFAFFLCVIQGSGPDFDLTIARDRVIGVLLGITVTYLIFTRIRPVSITRRVDPAIAALLRQMSAAARSPHATRPVAASALGGRISALADDLTLVGYEPQRVRLSDPWAESRRETVRAAAEMQRMMLLDDRPRFWDRVADRLDALAARLEGQGTAPPAPVAPADTASVADGPIQRRAGEQLTIMEQALAH